jgi:hypothetical protein
MSNKYASGRKSIAECDRCGWRYKLTQLRALVIRTKNTNILVCDECWEADHPQNMQGMYPVQDPQAVLNPRPDTSYASSRDIQWGWNPVGMVNYLGLSPNDLVAAGTVGEVTVTIT